MANPPRYYLIRQSGSLRRYLKVDYSRPEHYRVVSGPEFATCYDDQEAAEATARFLGGERLGIRVKREWPAA